MVQQSSGGKPHWQYGVTIYTNRLYIRLGESRSGSTLGLTPTDSITFVWAQVARAAHWKRLHQPVQSHSSEHKPH